MPRRKKLRFAKTVTYTPAGLSVDIYFDPNEGALNFVADFGGREYRGESVKELSDTMYQVLKRAADLDWQPIITVTLVEPFYHHSWPFVGLCLQRQYIAKVSDTSLRVVGWERWSDEPDFNPFTVCKADSWSTAWGEFDPPCTLGWSPDTDVAEKYYLPYTDELWEGLNEIVRGIERLRNRLGELLGTDQGIKTIADVGGNLLKLLPSPGEEDTGA